MVKSWLYCSLDASCIPGLASSARITMASYPAKRKKPNEVTRYMFAMVLWSVVVSHRRTVAPPVEDPLVRSDVEPLSAAVIRCSSEGEDGDAVVEQALGKYRHLHPAAQYPDEELGESARSPWPALHLGGVHGRD